MTITGNGAADLSNYVNSIKEGIYTPPKAPALKAMSALVDKSAERVFKNIEKTLKASPEMEKALATLKNSPRTCGGFKPKNACLKDLTSFEQMYALTSWVKENSTTMLKPHTVTLSANEGEALVPVWVKPLRSGGGPNLMTIFLGNTKGALKGPSYTDWAAKDPEENVFIEPLNSLEMHRQPGCLGGLILKAAPYEAGILSHTWRYKVYTTGTDFAPEASVELPKQRSKKSCLIKEQSAGYNLAQMINSPIRDKSILPELLFEEYHEEGYDDESIPSVSPHDIIKTFPEALKGNTIDLDALISQVIAPRLGKSSIGPAKDLCASFLFPED